MDVYRCAECGDELAGWDALGSHVAVEHVDWVPYLCVHCQQQKATKQQLLEHIHAKHPLLQPFECKKVDEAKERRLDDILQRSKPVGSTCPLPLPQPQRRSMVAVKPELVDLTEWDAVEPKVEVAPIAEPPPSETAEQKAPPADPPYESRRTAVSGRRELRVAEAPRRTLAAERKQKRARKQSQKQRQKGAKTSVCTLCETETANKHLLTHVCVYHVAEDAFRCGDCGFSGNFCYVVQAHIDASGHKAAAVVDVRLQMKPRIHKQFVECFGEEAAKRARFFKSEPPPQDNTDAATGGGGDAAAQEARDAALIRCMQCQALSHKNSLLSHVCLNHIDAGFRCGVCCFAGKETKKIRAHIAGSAHKGAAVVDVRMQMKPRIREQFVKCFGEDAAKRAHFFKRALSNVPPSPPPSHDGAEAGDAIGESAAQDASAASAAASGASFR